MSDNKNIMEIVDSIKVSSKYRRLIWLVVLGLTILYIPLYLTMQSSTETVFQQIAAMLDICMVLFFTVVIAFCVEKILTKEDTSETRNNN